MATTYTVVCMKWGDKYGAHYVNRLYNMVKRNTTLPLHFICFTENAEGILSDIEVRPLPEIKLPDNIERGWRKLALFAKNSGLTGRVLFLDLDTVIVGNIDPFFTIDGDFRLIKHWHPSVKQGIGETGVYRFEADKFCDLYEHFVEHMDEVKFGYRHEQAYVCGKLGQEGRLDFWPSEWMPSFKYTCMRPFPLCFFKEPVCPKSARMIVFHGHPTPDEAMEGKIVGIKKLWRHIIVPQWLKDAWI